MILDIITLICILSNFFVSVIALRSIRLLKNNSQKESQDPSSFQKSDIHTILNDRLVDIQNRKYSLQQKR